jgi:anti-anti-sigma factor
VEQDSFEVTAPHGSGQVVSTTAEAPLRMFVDLRVGRLSLIGRLDRLSTHTVQDVVPLLLSTEHLTWVLDAAGLEVGDSVGLRTLGAAYRRLLRHGRELRVVNESPTLRAVLTRLKLDVHLLVVTSHLVVQVRAIDRGGDQVREATG